MTSDFLAAAIAVAVAVVVVGLLFTMAAAISAMRTFRKSVQEITRNTLPLIADMHLTIKQANSDLLRVDELLETAESISTTVDSASRLAYTAFAGPLMKALAAGTGAARAFKVLRRRRTKGR